MSIKTPQNQKRLTNVAIVRLKKGGERFELACYPNKVMSWRQGAEDNLDEGDISCFSVFSVFAQSCAVLQVRTVFAHVGKGQPAGKDALKKAFGTEDESAIVLEILKKGELQVGGKERQQQIESLSKDIATLVADMCVDPETKRPITVSLVERAMREAHFMVNTNKPAKSQALLCIKLLREKNVIPIERAQIRLKITAPNSFGKKLGKLVQDEFHAKVLSDTFDAGWKMECIVDPGVYRKLEEAITEVSKGRGQVEILSVEVNSEEKKIDDE
jgi:ribosome maturation protein SDO1